MPIQAFSELLDRVSGFVEQKHSEYKYAASWIVLTKPIYCDFSFQKIENDKTVYRCFTLAVRIPELGKVRIVLSFDNADLTGTYATLITNRTDWNATTIIRVYLQR